MNLNRPQAIRLIKPDKTDRLLFLMCTHPASDASSDDLRRYRTASGHCDSNTGYPARRGWGLSPVEALIEGDSAGLRAIAAEGLELGTKHQQRVPGTGIIEPPQSFHSEGF
jgi:hypothetical protein